MKGFSVFALATLAVIAAQKAQGASAPVQPVPAPPFVTSYGDIHPHCRSWSDGCTVCLRQPDGEPACSTPGIACVQKPTGCLDPDEQPAAGAAQRP